MENSLTHNIFMCLPKACILLLPNDPIFTIVLVNRNFLTLTGTKKKDVKNFGLFEAFPQDPKGINADPAEFLRESFQFVRGTGEKHKMDVFRYDILIRNTNNFNEKYWEVVNSPIFNFKNEITHILCSVEDVTELHSKFRNQKDIKISFQDSQNRFGSLFLHNSNALFSFDLAGNFLEANKATAELFETTVQHLLKITFFRLIAKIDKGKVFSNFLKASNGEIVNYNTGLVTVKQNYRIINIVNSPIIVDGTIVGVYGGAKDITEELAAEKNLEVNRLKTQRILDQSLDVICAIDHNGLFREVSQDSHEQWGFHPFELIGRALTDIVYEEDLENTVAIRDKIINGGGTSYFHFRCLHKNGDLVPVAWSAKWDVQSRTMYCIARDATDSLKNTNSLLKSDQKFKFLFENNPTSILICDIENLNIIDCNIMALTKFGFEKIEFLKLNIMDIGADNQKEKLVKTLEVIKENKVVHNVVCKHRKKNGELFQAEISGQLIRIDGKDVVIVQISDVNERQQIKERYKDERDLLRSLIDNLPYSISFKDLNGKKLISNKMDYTFLGATKEEEVLGKTDLETLDGELAKKRYTQDLEILQTGNGSCDYEEYFKDSIHGSIWLSRTKQLLENDKGGIKGLLEIGVNITQQKIAQQHLEQINKKLEAHIEHLLKTNIELEQFAYVVSHDLQEPLRAISTFLAILKSKNEDILDETDKTYLNYAVDGSHHMRQLIVGLLELSTIGKNECEYEDINVNKVIMKIKENNALYYKGNNVSIQVDALPNVRALNNYIYQLFSNLISNSVKYKKEGITAEVKISVQSLEHFWLFSVQDNGIGIEPAYFDKIFVVFQRLHSKEKYSGTGIGLAIVKKIVKNLGGEIWVKSTLGIGSTFYFTLKK